MSSDLAKEWKGVEKMSQALYDEEALAALAAKDLAPEAAKLSARRAAAIAKLEGYMDPNLQMANEAMLGRLEVADEYNQAKVEHGNWRGTAEQFRRLDAPFANSPAAGERLPTRREQFDAAIEAAAMASIGAREKLSLANGFGDAKEVAAIERQLFAYRKQLDEHRAGRAAKPVPGDELADRMIQAARADKVYGHAIELAATGRQSFLFGNRMGQAEASVCAALKRHGESQYAAEALEANRASIAASASKLSGAFREAAAKAEAMWPLSGGAFDPGSADYHGRLDMADGADRHKAMQMARRIQSAFAQSAAL